MTPAPARFTCSDPEAGDFEFSDVEAVLDALEAGLVSAGSPLFDAVRQSMQPLGTHPEIRAAWAARSRYQPIGGLSLPELPSITAIVRALPEADDQRERRRAAFAAVRAGAPRRRPEAGSRSRPIAVAALLWGLLLLALVGAAVVIFAARLADLAATAVERVSAH
ncbi:MAG TPA: hypothetical protein VHR41_11770 [Gemmatimonadales bacterium]|jgi:hypothetical protein|nr:hypothetical protein [Gemmatimonadales bacterium]